MGLHLITGPATAGKTGALYRQTIERAVLPGLPVIVVPAEPDVRRVQAQLAQDGLMGVRVAQFDRWVDGLWRSHGDGRELVGPVVRTALMTRAAQASTDSSTPGWTPGMTSVLCDLVQKVQGDPKQAATDKGWVSWVLNEYWKLLDELRLIEHGEAAWLLAHQPPGGLGPIAINHFTDLSCAQEALIKGLSQVTTVGIALTWVQDMPATEALAPLVRRLLDAGAAHTAVPPGEWTHPELQGLGELLFSGEVRTGSHDVLELIQAAGAGAECSVVAERVAQLIDNDLEPDQVAIVARKMGGRTDELLSALGARGVPASADVAEGFSATPFGRALLGLLRAVTDQDATREDLLAHVLSPFSGVEPPEAIDLDRRLRQDRAKGAMLLRRALPHELAENVKLVRGISLAGSDSAAAWHRLGTRMLAAHLVARGPEPTTELHAASHRALMSAVGELLRSSQPADPLSVAAALRGVVVASGGEHARAVLVTEAHRLKGRRFKAVVIMGLNADEFSPERDPRLSVALARDLGLSPATDQRASERMLFYTLFTRASDRLILSRQAIGAQHEELTPSVFWDEVVDLTGQSNLAVARVPAALSLPVFAPGRLQARAAVRTPVPSATVGLDGQALDELMQSLEERELSASQIERYLACPYRWFLDFALRPTEIDVSVGAREMGSLSHALLSAFYDRWTALGYVRVTPGHLNEALELFSEVETEHAQKWSSKADGLHEELVVATACTRARAIVVDDADITPGFRPVGHEMTFGLAAGKEFTFGGVRIGGRIDRIEVGPAGVLAVDYKSSATVAGAAQLLAKGLLQPIIYAAAAGELLDKPVAGGVYRSLQSLKVRGFWRMGCVELGGRGSAKDGLEPEDIEALYTEAHTVVAGAYAAMRAGEISPRPSATACKQCLYSGVCEQSS